VKNKHTIPVDLDELKALRKLHISYIHFLARITKQGAPSLNFWGIKTFEDYLVCFAKSASVFSEVSHEEIIELAKNNGYDLSL